MTRIAERKTKVTLITNATARYRGKDRAIVIHALPDIAQIRLLGTRTVYEVSWRGLFDFAGRITAEKARAERKARAKGARA
jgi:hypothetical protein